MINLSANTRKVNDPKVGLLCTEVTEKFPPEPNGKDIVIHDRKSYLADEVRGFAVQNGKVTA
jgi:hypothetical protein